MHYLKNFKIYFSRFLTLFFLPFLFSCRAEIASTSANDVPSGPFYDVKVDWAANREKAVNSSGGGYIVSFGKTSNFDFNAGSRVTVAYVAGAATSTTTTVSLPAGTYYIKVAAYSSLTPPNSSSTAISEASNQIAITVP